MSEPLDQAPDRIELLLMRVLDGEASVDERAELGALADTDARLAEYAGLRARLRLALSAPELGEVDVVAQVFEALGLQDGWAPVGAALREGLQVEAPDLSAAILAALRPEPEPEPDALLSAMVDGELPPEARAQVVERLRSDRGAVQALTDFAEVGRLVRDEVARRAGPAAEAPQVWAAVAPRIGLADPEEVPGWAPVGAALREAVLARAQLSAAEHAALTGAILNALPRPEPVRVAPPPPAPVPLWRLLLGNPTLVAAVVSAVVLVAFQLQGEHRAGQPAPAQPPAAVAQAPAEPFGDLPLQAWNQAELHNIEYAADVAVQVVQLEDGAPMLLMIEELEGEQGVPL